MTETTSTETDATLTAKLNVEMESKVKMKNATWEFTTPTKRPLDAEPTANCQDAVMAFWILVNNAILVTSLPLFPTLADPTALSQSAVMVLLMLVNNATTVS